MRGKVFRQVLVDMPFSLPESPAFGLSQIKSYLAQEMPTEVETNILYLNHDFYKYFGEEIYQLVNKDFYKFYKFDDNKFLWVDDLRKSGLEVEYFGGSLGNWIFRQEAYCEIEDNAQQYFEKYYTNQSDLIQKIIRTREHLHEQLVNYLEQYRLDEYDLVGFTSRFQQQTAALSLARLIKERNPECVTIIGGPNLEPPAGAAAAGLFKNIDYILSGRRFLIGYKQLVQALIRRDRSSIMKIPGVFCKDKNSDMESIDPYEASHEDDINALLDLDYDEFFYSLEQKLGNCYKHKVVFLETSRGCSWGEKKKVGS